MKRIILLSLFLISATCAYANENWPGILHEVTLTYDIHFKELADKVAIHIATTTDFEAHTVKISHFDFSIDGNKTIVSAGEFEAIEVILIHDIEYYYDKNEDGTLLHYIRATIGPYSLNAKKHVTIMMEGNNYLWYSTHVSIRKSESGSKWYGLSKKYKGKPVVQTRNVDEEGNITEL